MLERVWEYREKNTYVLLVGIYVAYMENYIQVPEKIKSRNIV
jgi:hypothetical protein